jgi:ElaB/YqjD/DUF883 family membrane-anchored ribosome-binding protein
MGITDWETDPTGETAARIEESDRSCCDLGNMKNIIADKLHQAAEALYEKAIDQDAPSEKMAQYGIKASELLDQSAEYIRQFDYQEADVKVRDYVRERPGRSLLIAGAVGLVIGAMCRHR